MPLVSVMLEVCFMYNDSDNTCCKSNTSGSDQMCDPNCVAAIAVGVLAAILLILLVVAITGWVCTYMMLMKKLRQSMKNNSR